MHDLPSPVRICLLLGYRIEDPLPEAVELAKAAALDFQRSALAVDVRVDLATVAALKREAARGCDLLFFYGHGTADGRLVFVDDHFAVEELTALPELVALWRRLVGCFVFACYGYRFAEALPCSWLAFRQPILTTAPKGFVHALVPLLSDMDLPAALAEARRLCSLEMTSNFTDVLSSSERPWPARRLPRGQARFSRASPALTGRYHVDFGSVRQDDHVYPDHDPFVGRVDDLRDLLELPSPFDDRPMQRAIWVHGDSGMGKSALLREFATLVRDLEFRDLGEEVHLLHLYCFPFTRPQQVVDALGERARELYGLPEVPRSPEVLARGVESAGGTHVWVLDDLTYLSIDPARIGEAESLVRGLMEAARAHAVRLELVVSTRRSGPVGIEKLSVGPLAFAEALALGVQVWHQGAQAFAESEDAFAAGIAHLFHVVGRSTSSFKRSLLMAATLGVAVGEYARDLGHSETLESMEEGERAKEVLSHEFTSLASLERKHGFAYRKFLSILYRLVKRAAYFSLAELEGWFGDRFVVGRIMGPGRPSYRNGAIYLMRLGFLLARGSDQDQVFSLPPNQRLGLRSLDDPDESMPSAVPLRGATERLSLALERMQLGDMAAVGDLLEMENEYRADLPRVDAAAAVFASMLTRADYFASERLGIFDEMLRLHDEAASHYSLNIGINTAIALALNNKAAVLGQSGRPEDEIRVQEDVEARFGNMDDVPVIAQVVRAKAGKAARLYDLGRFEEGVATCEEVLRRYGHRREVLIGEQVAGALGNKAVNLAALGRYEEAIAACEEVRGRCAGRDDVSFVEKDARATFNHGEALRKLGRWEEAIAKYGEVATRFGERHELLIAVEVAKATYNLGLSLGEFEKFDQQIAVFGEIEKRFATRREPELLLRVMRALIDQGLAYRKLGRPQDAVAAWDKAVRIGDAREGVEFAAEILRALECKAMTLGSMRLYNEAICAWTELVGRLSGREELAIAVSVAQALLSKAGTLAALGSSEQALAAYDQLISTYGMRTEEPLTGALATARLLRALAGAGNKAERIAALRVFVDAYSKSQSAVFRDMVELARGALRELAG
jgi:tetratricopeptide (TPR) repeat protein